MKVFNLPDLGEGLPDAEIVEWLVEEGDTVSLDQPLVSMETAKAVVEVPSPFAGKVVTFHGQAGDVIATGAPLATFADEGDAETPAANDATGQPAPISKQAAVALDDQSETPEDAGEPDDATGQVASKAASQPEPERADAGTVVGNVESSSQVWNERASSVGGVKVTPAVRALARKLKVDLSQVAASGTHGVVTAADVRQAAAKGPSSKQTASAPSPSPTVAPADAGKPSATAAEAQPENAVEDAGQADDSPGDDAVETTAPAAGDDWQPLRGPRRTMARVMAASHQSVVPTTLMDDADLHAWRSGEDITVRLLRAIAVAARAEPGLNAWFDGKSNLRMVHKNLHVGMAVDTPDGLFVAALRDVGRSDAGALRAAIDRLRDNVTKRSIPPEDLKDFTFVLSNFGKFAGRYATPVITPPCVAILAAGTLRHEVVPVLGGIEVHRLLPLSLTFDHRACTGGEAARFLKAMLQDLARAA